MKRRDFLSYEKRRGDRTDSPFKRPNQDRVHETRALGPKAGIKNPRPRAFVTAEQGSASRPGQKNPYAKQLKQQITILLDKEAVAYFKKLAAETGVAYQVLINLYLKECAQLKKTLSFGEHKLSRKRAA